MIAGLFSSVDLGSLAAVVIVVSSFCLLLLMKLMSPSSACAFGIGITTLAPIAPKIWFNSFEFFDVNPEMDGGVWEF
jgi:hypothetical protein